MSQGQQQSQQVQQGQDLNEKNQSQNQDDTFGMTQAQEEQKQIDLQQQENNEQAERFLQYVKDTGIGTAFQIIFAEIMSKKVKEENVFTYTTTRLREIGTDIKKIQDKAQNHKK